MSLKSLNINEKMQDIYKSITNDGKLKAVILTFILGMLVHMFGLVNILHNHDDIGGFVSGNGAGVTSGRWGLTIFGNFIWKNWGINNNSYLLGVLFIFLLSIATWFIVDMFNIKNCKLGVVIGISLIVFPSSVSILFYRFAAGYYGFAILLAVMAVWFLNKYKLTGGIIAIICIAVSLGIYQAFLPLTISLMVITLIYKILKDDYNFLKTFKAGIYYCIVLIGGLVLYYFILKMSLRFYNAQLTDYQGINQMGSMSFTTIIDSIVKAYGFFILMPFYDYCMLAPNNFLKITYQLLIAGSLIVFVYAAVRKKNPGKIIMLALLIICLPLAIDFIQVMCPNGFVYTLMVYSFVALFIFSIVLYDCVDTKSKIISIVKKSVLVVVVAMLLNYTYVANVNYQTMYFTARQTENYLGSMLTQVRMTEGYKTYMPWAFIGDSINDPSFRNYAFNKLMYGGNNPEYINEYTRHMWLRAYNGFDIPYADSGIRNILAQDERVKAMPCYPDNGSIKVIDDVVVIKLQ